MAIDTRTSRSGKSNRNKYYKKEFVENMKLVQDAKAQGVFYSNDEAPFSSTAISSGNIMKKQTTGTLVTEDIVDDLEVNDFVMNDGNLYLVVSIDREDNDDQKWFSNFPSKITKIRLRR
jgi:hypothetical protein